MQLKTSSIEFEKYGSVYVPPIAVDSKEMISRIWHLITVPSISQVFYYNCDVYIELQSGLSNIIIGDSPELSELTVFSMHRGIHIKAGKYFALAPISYSITYRIVHSISEKSHSIVLAAPYTIRRIRPRIRINEILGYYYSVRTSGYQFLGDSHNCYELTYVDRGSIVTTVNNNSYKLGERELIIYGPGQFHTQYIEEGCSCSYVTIMFEMEMTSNTIESLYDSALLNRVFHYDKKVFSLIKSFIAESDSNNPFTASLLICHLQELIVRLLTGESDDTTSKPPASESRQHYKDELFENILAHIDESIYQPLSIMDLCQTFSLSRSYLQTLFNSNLGITPRKYINDLKLQKSKQLISEHRHSISEIAIMLGYNSIHYFSRSFSQKYGISPSEYSKQLYSIK